MQWKAARWSVAAMLLFSAGIAGATTSYRFTIDPDASSVDAKVAFMGVGNRRAFFPAVRGTVALTPDAMDQIDLNVTIDATQLRADDRLTTSRLKGDAFFNVARYPNVRFEGTDLTMATQTSGIVRGNLTARGITRPVALNISFSAPPSSVSAREGIGLTGVTTINRKDFGMTAYSLIVGKTVTISIRTKLKPT